MKSSLNSGLLLSILLPMTFVMRFAASIWVWEASVSHIHLNTIFFNCHRTCSPSLPPPFLPLPPLPSHLNPLQHYHHLRSYFFVVILSKSSVIKAQPLALEGVIPPFIASIPVVSFFVQQLPLLLHIFLASMMISW